MRQNQRDARSDSFITHYAGEICSAFLKSIEGDGTKRIFANLGNEPYFASQYRKIVCQDRGGTAKRHREAMAQQFTFRRQLLRKTVHNQIEIKFSSDADVELWHTSVLSAEFHNSAQVFRRVWVQSFAKSGKYAIELAPNGVSGESRVLRHLQPEFNRKIGSSADPVVN